MHPLFDDPFRLTKWYGNCSGSGVHLPLGHTTIRAIFNWVGHCYEIAIISHTETAETMAMTPSSVFGSLPPKNSQYEPLIAATHYIDRCLGPSGSPAALVARNTANGADMASVRGERDGRNSPIVATVVSLHGHHHHHPSTPRLHTVISEGCYRSHKPWGRIDFRAADFWPKWRGWRTRLGWLGGLCLT